MYVKYRSVDLYMYNLIKLIFMLLNTITIVPHLLTHLGIIFG